MTTRLRVLAVLHVTVALTVAVIHPLQAQNGRSATLLGAVVDQTGAAIANASVTLRRDAVGYVREMSADALGGVQFADLPPGEYSLRATSAGFTVATERITLQAGQTQRVEFVLQVGSLSEDVYVLANEVVGNAERLRRLPGSVDVVDRETLEDANVMTTNEALRKVAGVNVRDEEGFGLRPNIGIRGINPTRSSKVLLLEDGIPLTYAPYRG